MPEVNRTRWKELVVRKAMGILTLREKVEYLLAARRLGKEQVAEDVARAKKAVAEAEAEEKRLKTDYQYALEKTGKFHKVERIPYGKVIVDIRVEDEGGYTNKVLSTEVIDRFPPGAPDFAIVEMFIGYLDVVEKYGFETDYIEAPFDIKQAGLFSKRDPYAQRENIIDMLNSALSQRGMYYDGYAMRRC